jgi:hypothetical protein
MLVKLELDRAPDFSLFQPYKFKVGIQENLALLFGCKEDPWLMATACISNFCKVSM